MECCNENWHDRDDHNCRFDLDMILWVLIIIVIVTCVCD